MPPLAAMRSPGLLLAAAVLAACSRGGDRGASTGGIGGTVVIALPASPNPLLPTHLVGAPEKQVADQIFDPLAEIGPGLVTLGDSGWTPRLATAWTWSADSLSIAFSLHPAARWHDGRPVTSRDVQFTVGLFKDPRVGSPLAGGFAAVDSVTTPDSLTAVVWYARRSPEQFYDVVHSLLIMPEHLLRDADRATFASHPFGQQPVGSGPFRFVRWLPRQVLEVEADTAYHLGRPKLNRVIWTLDPDVNTALVKVLAGEADLLESLSPDGMARVAAQQTVRAVPYPNLNYGYLAFNMRDPANPDRPHALFADRELRRALSMGINRRALLANVFDSLAWLGAGPFSRAQATADTSLRAVDFDSAGAGRLLDSLGWRDADGDGVRERGGRALRFGLTFPTTSSPRRRYAELIQAQLRPHGVRVDVDGVDFSVLRERIPTGKFDAIINNLTLDPSPSGIRDQWYSATPRTRRANYQLYGNPVVDAVIDSAMREVNPARSRAHFRKAYQLILDDAPAVWLYENRSFMALHGRIVPVLEGANTWWRKLRLWSIPAAGRIARDAN